MKDPKQFCVYFLASKKRGTIYIGITSNLKKRMYEHQTRLITGFTKTYDVKNLVYYESHDNAEAAIRREKRYKKWNRDWKINLIEEYNRDWTDLTPTL